ncbi:MAG TPA: hypothetical protein VGW39_00925 [Chthoniobacterales bacterium]|nr:hypothetical protein [Chthoniobacterales bacterium]
MNAYSFTAGADYRLHAATMTRFGGGGSADTSIDLIASDSTTALETNDDDGATGTASNIAGAVVAAAAGTSYVRARQFDAASLPGASRSHDFFLRVDLGSPIPEMEPPDEDAPQVPRSNGSGGRVIRAATAKNDLFAITVNAGDTIGVIVRVDLERGAPAWKAMAGIGALTGCFVITLERQRTTEELRLTAR